MPSCLHDIFNASHMLTDDCVHCYCRLKLAVCAIELWPEARSCKNDKGLALGIILGLIAMLFTLVAESLHAAHMSAGLL